MKTQQQAHREEQQRIKNLVLNYDLSNDNDHNDGEDGLSMDPHPQRIPNAKTIQGFEKRSSHRDLKVDRSGSNRSGFRARRLQLSDVDWYDHGSGTLLLASRHPKRKMADSWLALCASSSHHAGPDLQFAVPRAIDSSSDYSS